MNDVMHVRSSLLPVLCLSAVVCYMSVLSGCLSVKATRYGEHDLPPSAADTIIHMVDLNNVARPYEVIGYVEVKTDDIYDTQRILEVMRTKAKRMGGDAISDMNQEHLEDRFWPIFDYLNFYDKVWSCEVIRWRDE